MRHQRSGTKLNRTATHRKAMLGNLATSILDKGRVRTTVIKAKVVRSVVERLVTYGKKGDLHGIRLAARIVKDKDVLKKLSSEIAPGYKARNGGYTRIIKTTERDGDNAPMCIIELVGLGDTDVKRKPKRKAVKKAARKRVPAAAKPGVTETAAPASETAPTSGESKGGETK